MTHFWKKVANDINKVRKKVAKLISEECFISGKRNLWDIYIRWIYRLSDIYPPAKAGGLLFLEKVQKEYKRIGYTICNQTGGRWNL